MSKPSLSLDDAQLRGMSNSDINRVSRATPRGFQSGGRPKFPKDDLPPEALPTWKALVKQLARRKVLTPGDGPALTIYCRTFLHWKDAAHEVELNGTMIDEPFRDREGKVWTRRVVNPAVKVAADLAAELKDSLKDFGLTGISRDKVSKVQPRQPKTAEPGTVDFFKQQAAKAEDAGSLDLNDVTDELSQKKEEGNGDTVSS